MEAQVELLGRAYTDRKIREFMLGKVQPEDFSLEILRFLWDCLSTYCRRYGMEMTRNSMATHIGDCLPGGRYRSKYIVLPEHVAIMAKTYDSLWREWPASPFEFYTQNTDLILMKERAYKANVDMQSATSLASAEKAILAINKAHADFTAKARKFETDMLDDDAIPTKANPALHRITTGIPKLDSLMHGGLGVGKYGLLVACPGVGKTTSLLNFAISALMSGHIALFLTLEMERFSIQQRFRAMLANINANYFNQNVETWPPEVVEQLRRSTLEELRGRCTIVDISEYTPKMSDIQGTVEDWLNRMDAKYAELGTKRPEALVAIDWLDIIDTRSLPNLNEQSNDAAKLSQLGYAVRQLAVSTKTAMWTATQGTREADGRERLKMKHTSGAYHKMDSPDFGLGLGIVRDANNTMEDEADFSVPDGDDDSTAMLACDRDLCFSTLKNRNGPFRAVTIYQGKSLRFWPNKGAAEQAETLFQDADKYEQYKAKFKNLVERERTVGVS